MSEAVKKKVVLGLIDKCQSCPHFEVGQITMRAFGAKFWYCAKVAGDAEKATSGTEIFLGVAKAQLSSDSVIIPDWCPLPDAEEAAQ